MTKTLYIPDTKAMYERDFGEPWSALENRVLSRLKERDPYSFAVITHIKEEQKPINQTTKCDLLIILIAMAVVLLAVSIVGHLDDATMLLNH